MRSTILTAVLLNLVAALHADESPRVVILRADDRTPAPSEITVDGRLARELGRQALLLAVREDFGLWTRDERLGEALDLAPTNRIALDLTARVRTHWREPTGLTLMAVDAPRSLRVPVELPIERLEIPRLYAQLAIAWEASSRGELADRLEDAGLERRKTAPNPANRPTDEVASLLADIDWLSQFTAVRAAHQAIANEGVSVEWLSVLARGYAHLGTLVEHHWTDAPEVFFARSLLYAERARGLDPKGIEARLLRPYALAFASAHANALTEFEAIDVSDESLPGWAELIEPACRFELDRLRQVGDRIEDARPMSRWLVLCLRRTFGGHRQLHDFAMDVLDVSPTAYGAYSNLVTYYPSLLSQRIGANGGPEALGTFLPSGYQRVMRQQANVLDESGFALRAWGFSNKVQASLEQSTRLGANLRLKARTVETPAEPSWGVLASVVEEEVFVMCANYCKAMTNQVETSLTAEVDTLLPLIEGHPYASYVRLYRYPRSEQPSVREELFGNLVITGPRHNMREMLLEVAKLPDDPQTGGMNTGRAASWRAYQSADYRLASIAEEKIGGGTWWWGRLSDVQRRRVFEDYRQVSPHSLHWLRGTLSMAKNPTADQLAKWEPLAVDDCTACEWIGHHYFEAGDTARSLDWYRRAYELVPNRGTVWKMARIHRSEGDLGKWLGTLDHCLENVEPRGLEHVALRIDIARTLMREDRDFTTAIRYAEEAAEAHSAAGLSVAMAANEGAGNLERADDFARQASTSYASKWGDQWYLFRKRNHYGDADEARPFIEKTMQADRGRRWLKLFLPVLDGDLKTAFERYHAEGVRTREVYWYMMSSLLAAELGDEVRLAQELRTVRALNDRYMKGVNPPFYAMVNACSALLEAPESAEIDPVILESHLAGMAAGYRRDYEFFLGATLQVIGREPKLSEAMLRCSAETPDFSDMNGNLSKYYLGRTKSVAQMPAALPVQSSEE